MNDLQMSEKQQKDGSRIGFRVNDRTIIIGSFLIGGILGIFIWPSLPIIGFIVSSIIIGMLTVTGYFIVQAASMVTDWIFNTQAGQSSRSRNEHKQLGRFKEPEITTGDTSKSTFRNHNSNDNTMEIIKELKELNDDGVISDDEFAMKKKELLDEV